MSAPDDAVRAGGAASGADRLPDDAAGRIWGKDHTVWASDPTEITDRVPGFERVVRPGDLATISAPIDWVGVNYYNRQVVADAPGEGMLEVRSVRTENEHTSIGWEVYPDALRELLVRIHRDWKPKALMVTENGAGWDDAPGPDGRVEDEKRRRYIEDHLAACRDALQEGVPLEGYFAWTLVDNFEWAEGYANRFGIVRMAEPGGSRVVKRSGEWYGAFARGDLARGLACDHQRGLAFGHVADLVARMRVPAIAALRPLPVRAETALLGLRDRATGEFWQDRHRLAGAAGCRSTFVVHASCGYSIGMCWQTTARQEKRIRAGV